MPVPDVTVTVVTEQIPGPPGPVGANVTELSALAPLPPASALAGMIASYTPVANGSSVFYLWAPGSTATPDGLNTVAGNGGNWVLLRGIGGNAIATHVASYDVQQFDQGADFPSAGGLTCTMPADPPIGWPYLVSVGAGGVPLTVEGNGNTINGGTSFLMPADYQSMTLVFNGTEYRIY